ncbi:uncharacterized protein LOC107364506 isoform X2 [Tetranychus urticae]|uniref:Uncharacterized protein n=2 Tax=Tetranychus urticae TaxID=32264 RepID=T1KIV1_TETUR|nr:uncharacterized protein LOC107364506 isoform X2 [Tetranychus urticae]XP_015787363.1 uncharacterized protein LOC107364506 isoform X2 [Tetranychus urticae]XP_015787364.1 uncharacterized protein LOC107364506 isoform X2 [Tetranychus urticae]XP_015787365.1 uncharacterized protein LOC107364506 isoform X2 [Tetranychus urticae]
MGDRQKNFKFNARNGGVSKIQDEMRKNLQNKRRQDRFTISGDKRPSLDEWDAVCSFFENQAVLTHSTDDIVNYVKSHPYLNAKSTYPDGYIQNASEKLKDYIKSAIELLCQQRAIFKHIQYRFTTCVLTADKLPILLKNEETIETVMDTSEVNVSVASDENDIENIADVFITQNTVDCALKILSTLINKGELTKIDSSLLILLIEFIAFISSLRPSCFKLTFLQESFNDFLQTIASPKSSDLNHITNLLFFLYNIFEAKSLPIDSSIFALILAIEENFHHLASTLSDTHSTEESTIKYFMGVSVIFKFAFECIKTEKEQIGRDQTFAIYQKFQPLLIDSAKVMVREYPFISLNLSSILADYSDFYVGILTQESVYRYVIKTFRDSGLMKNSYRMAINLANKLEPNEFENFLTQSNFFYNFAESLKLGKHEASRASYSVLEIVFKRLPLQFVALNLIDSGLFNQICEHYFWGSDQDKLNFHQIAPIVLKCEQSSQYIDTLLDSDLLSAFFSDINKASDGEIFNAIFCVYKLFEWSNNAGKLELFKEKIQQTLVLTCLYNPEITNRGNSELEAERKTILGLLHGKFAN